MTRSTLSLAILLALPSCAGPQAAQPVQATTCPRPAEAAPAPAPQVAAAEAPAPAVPSTTTTRAPAEGALTFRVYDGFLSPMQEPGEESETPKLLQRSLGATAPSTPRKQRGSRGYGQLRVARDLSKAQVDVRIEGVRAEDILMFHIHCGPPGVLGPILVDLGHARDLTQELADGQLSLELTDEDITYSKGMKGISPGLPEGCPIELGLVGQVKTIAGLDALARKGVLYFNLHTRAHTYYGEMRGQLYVADER